MKKTTLLLALALVLAGCRSGSQEAPPAEDPNTEANPAVQAPASDTGQGFQKPSQEPNQQADPDDLQATLAEEEAQMTGAFNEVELTPTDLPQSRLSMETLQSSYQDLHQAMNDYFLQELSEAEKAANTHPIPEEDLATLERSLASNDVLAPLQVQVDQVTIPLGGQTNYVTRLVVPMPYEKAERTLADHDILLLNEALALVGDRLTLLAHWDPQGNSLTPMHLANSSHAIFYNDIPAP